MLLLLLLLQKLVLNPDWSKCARQNGAEGCDLSLNHMLPCPAWQD